MAGGQRGPVKDSLTMRCRRPCRLQFPVGRQALPRPPLLGAALAAQPTGAETYLVPRCRVMVTESPPPGVSG